MKAYKYIIVAAAILLGVASCSKTNEFAPDRKDGKLVPVTIGANFSTTKTTMASNGDVLWSSTDKIKVQIGGNAYDFELKSGANTTAAVFHAVVTESDAAILAGTAVGTVSGYYPVSGAAVPATQTYAEGTFADGMNPMTATYANGTLTFTNDAAVVRVQGISATATSAVLSYTVSETEYSVTMALTAGSAAKDLYFVVVPGAQDFYLSIDGGEATLHKSSEVTEAGSRYNVSTPVAKIGTKYFDSLDAAFAAVAEGDTIDLLSNTTLSATKDITKTMTLNLKNNTITAACSGYLFNLNTTEAGKKFTVTGTDADNCGHIVSNGTSGHSGIACINASSKTVTLEMNAVKAHGATEADAYIATSVIVSDNSESRNDLIHLTDVSIKGNQDLVSGSAGRAYAKINVKGGVYSTTQRGFRFCSAKDSTSVIDGANITTKNGIAVYAFSNATLKNSIIDMTATGNNDAISCSGSYYNDATLTIENTTVTAKGTAASAVAAEDLGNVFVESGEFANEHTIKPVIKVNTSSGTLTFNGGTIIAKSEGQTTIFTNTKAQSSPDPDAAININGGIIYGTADVSSDNAFVNIYGGTFKSAFTLKESIGQYVRLADSNTAIFESTVNNSYNRIIKSGTFKGAVTTGNNTLQGGTYYVEPAAAKCVSGYIVQAQGTDPETWKVVEKQATKVSNETELKNAIANSTEGEEIKLTASFTISSALVVDKNVVINLNGKTITAGSSLTAKEESLRPVSLKANGVVIKNGTITGPSVTPEYPMINVHKTCTLENVIATTPGVAVRTRDNATLTITGENGSYSSTHPYYSNESKINDRCFQSAVYVTTGTVNIEGGEFSGGSYAVTISTSGGTANISGGTFYAGGKQTEERSGNQSFSLFNDGNTNTTKGYINISGSPVIKGSIRGRVNNCPGQYGYIDIQGGVFDSGCRLWNYDEDKISYNQTKYTVTTNGDVPQGTSKFVGKQWILSTK